MVLRKSFYIRWSAGRSPRVHEVNSGRDPSLRSLFNKFQICLFFTWVSFQVSKFSHLANNNYKKFENAFIIYPNYV